MNCSHSHNLHATQNTFAPFHEKRGSFFPIISAAILTSVTSSGIYLTLLNPFIPAINCFIFRFSPCPVSFSLNLYLITKYVFLRWPSKYSTRCRAARHNRVVLALGCRWNGPAECLSHFLVCYSFLNGHSHMALIPFCDSKGRKMIFFFSTPSYNEIKRRRLSGTKPAL